MGMSYLALLNAATVRHVNRPVVGEASPFSASHAAQDDLRRPTSAGVAFDGVAPVARRVQMGCVLVEEE
jgi:hypothetical protein